MLENVKTETNEFDNFDWREDLLGRGVKSNNKEDVRKNTSNEVEDTITRREKDMGESL